MPAPVRRRWTLPEFRALIDAADGPVPRYELVDGELLVTGSPITPHQRAVRRLLRALDTWLDEHPVGEAFDSPFDVELEPYSIVRPDVFVVPTEESKRLDTEMPARTLTLVIEVLSPSSAYGDRGPKRELYQRHVPEYWIVDVDAKLIERWRPDDLRPEILHAQLEWRPRGAAATFELDLPEFFARVGTHRLGGPAASDTA